jgi:hypothetical protein
MIRPTAILCLSAASGFLAADQPDLLRFTNSDQLHGKFLGIKPGPQAVWQRDDLEKPVDFKTERLRHIVLHGGRPLRALESLSHAGLVNGDRIPGEITGIDDEIVTLDTTCAGVLRIPRRQVSMLAPSPLGGRVYYHGPFSEDDWKMAHAAYPEGLPEAAPDEPEADEGGDEEADDTDPPERWAFSGSAWYWQKKNPGTALIREQGMPDRAVLSFDLAWKNRLSLAIGFHSDFATATPKDEDGKKARRGRNFVPGDTSDLPRVFGNSYVLQLVSNYLMLFRTTVAEDGEVAVERVQMNNNNLRLGKPATPKSRSAATAPPAEFRFSSTMSSSPSGARSAWSAPRPRTPSARDLDSDSSCRATIRPSAFPTSSCPNGTACRTPPAACRWTIRTSCSWPTAPTATPGKS